MTQTALFAITLTVTQLASAMPLDRPALITALDRAIDGHSTSRRTTISLKVVDLQTGETLYDRGGDRLLIPASNLKIYTSACTLDKFGPDHRFVTRVEASGPVREGTLPGNLMLIGGGDAMFSSDNLAALADRVVKELKITRIEGAIVVDNSRYAARLKGPGWMWDDDPDYYNMSVTPLMIDFNVMTVRLAHGSDGTLQAALVPAATYPPIRWIETEAPAGTQITREPFTDVVLVAAREPLDKPVEQRLTMHDPAPWAAALFRHMLLDRKVDVADTPTTAAPREESSRTAHPRLVHQSVALSETLQHFHRASENAVGEVLLHELAIAHGISRPSWADGAHLISTWLTDTAKLNRGSFRLVDGSGLSRYNLISADSAVKLLAFMREHEHYSVFLESLPPYAVDLDGHQGPQAATHINPQRVAAKSGGMTGVSTISGYVRTLDGRELAFSLLANGFIGSNAPVRDLRQKVWQQLVQYRPH